MQVQVVKSKKATEEAKEPSKLAKGVPAKDSKQTRASIASQKKAASSSRKAYNAITDENRRKDKAAKKATAKAPDKKAETKTSDARKIKIADKGYVFGKEGTKRREAWELLKASATTADYAAKGGPTKYLSRWVHAGAITLSA